MSSYAINMNDGRIVFRNAEIDAQVNMKSIPDSVVEMITKGEVSTRDVINAISMKMKESGDFNISEYVEQLKKLNVRKSNVQDAPSIEPLKDRSEEEVSISDVKAAQSKSETKEEKKVRAKKVNAALENSGVDDIFK